MIAPSGALTTLYRFSGQADGAGPVPTLTLGSDGNFYGTTYAGGTITAATTACQYGCGTVFQMTPSGALTTLYSFSGPDGLNPSGLTLGSDGNFYGTTGRGGSSLGSSACSLGCGTVFQLTPSATLTTLYNFSGPDGQYPYFAALTPGGVRSSKSPPPAPLLPFIISPDRMAQTPSPLSCWAATVTYTGLRRLEGQAGPARTRGSVPSSTSPPQPRSLLFIISAGRMARIPRRHLRWAATAISTEPWPTAGQMALAWCSSSRPRAVQAA